MSRRVLSILGMTWTVAWALCATSAMAQTATTASDIPNAKDIRHLLEITGAANLASQMAADTTEQLMTMLRAANPQVPNRANNVVNREVMSVVSAQVSNPGGLIDQMVPVYSKYFTPAEIRDLITFYETPTGKKTVATMAQVMSDSIAIRQKWGQAMVPEIDRRVTDALGKEGLLPKKPAPETKQSPTPQALPTPEAPAKPQ